MQAPVSVIIPCYRCSATVARAVDSVVAQSLRPAELILIDDGSDDETPETLRCLQNAHGKDWIKVVTLAANHGVSVARNAGWDCARQEYLAFLDADDAWHPEKIALQYAWMRDHPHVSASGHQWVYLDPEDALPFPRAYSGLTGHEISNQRLLLSNPIVTPSVMLRRALPHRFDPSKRFCEDYLLWLQLALDGHKIYFLDAELAFVFKRIGKSGASRDLLRMRYGDITNYWQLWQSKRLGLPGAVALIGYSMLKFVVLLVFGPRGHYALKQVIERRLK